MENIADADYMHAKSVCMIVKENICLHYPKFLLTSGLARQAVLKSIKVELEQFTDIDISFMVEKGIRGRLCYSINDMKRLNHKFMKDSDKNKESPYE